MAKSNQEKGILIMNKEITPEQASKKLYNLLAEKAGIEKQVDHITEAKEAIAYDELRNDQ